MSDAPIYATLLVDDPPANATYWARLQQTALGFVPSERGGWGRNWRNLEPAAWFRAEDARALADVIEEFGLRGKFTCLPCPAGLGRLDTSVRGFPDLPQFLDVVRNCIAPHFDITPEVLTHSMVLDVEKMALLPHAESAWLTHLCLDRKMAELKQYLTHAYTILRNVGIVAHGLTIGGMADVSNIAQGKMLEAGSGEETLAEALLEVEQTFDPSVDTTFLYTGAPPRNEHSIRTRAPGLIYTAPDGRRAYTIHAASEDVVFAALHGPGDQADKMIDALVSPDLSDGLLVREAEAGRAVVFAVHGQTLCAMNSGAGIAILRQALYRFHQRFGQRIVWQTCRQLCQRTASSP